MRAVLETHFSCAKCGSELELEYESYLKQKPKSTKATQITGAYKLENRVFVYPCKVCLEPLAKITRALTDLGIQNGA